MDKRQYMALIWAIFMGFYLNAAMIRGSETAGWVLVALIVLAMVLSWLPDPARRAKHEIGHPR